MKILIILFALATPAFAHPELYIHEHGHDSHEHEHVIEHK
mgnify:CR=1 FL=1